MLQRLRLFDRVAQRAATQVISGYSSSFQLATFLLAARFRPHIRSLYAMVRIADEIVDGAALDPEAALATLDSYEEAVLRAPQQRFHVDPVLHAYANTARACGFEEEYLRAFFRSMRMDVAPQQHSEATFEEYVYGSAEVIGLLCVQVFCVGRPQLRTNTMDEGARALGAAFQKINFLRDYAEDTVRLGRCYFPQGVLTDASKAEIVASIEGDLVTAREAIPLLPRGARLGVSCATALFTRLQRKLAATPAERIVRARIRLNAFEKAIVLFSCLVRRHEWSGTPRAVRR